MDFMAKHGIQGLIGGGSAEGGAMHKVVLGWQEAHARHGKHLELGERLCFGFHFYLAKNREQGIREAAKYYEENMKMFGELRLVRALTDEQIEIMRDPKRAPTAKLPRIEDAIANGGFLCGSPEQVIEHLKSLERRYPGPRPRLGQPVGRRAEIGVPRTARVVRERGHAGLRAGQGPRTGNGELASARVAPPPSPLQAAASGGRGWGRACGLVQVSKSRSSVVARRRSRGCKSSCGRPRCIVQRLSQITRSPTRHLWL